jgi:hypothetical protein
LAEDLNDEERANPFGRKTTTAPGELGGRTIVANPFRAARGGFAQQQMLAPQQQQQQQQPYPGSVPDSGAGAGAGASSSSSSAAAAGIDDANAAATSSSLASVADWGVAHSHGSVTGSGVGLAGLVGSPPLGPSSALDGASQAPPSPHLVPPPPPPLPPPPPPPTGVAGAIQSLEALRVRQAGMAAGLPMTAAPPPARPLLMEAREVAAAAAAAANNPPPANAVSRSTRVIRAGSTAMGSPAGPAPLSLRGLLAGGGGGGGGLTPMALPPPSAVPVAPVTMPAYAQPPPGPAPERKGE